jgi:hypothetical protein
MKTERVTLLTSPDFKEFLNVEAEREGVSVAELVRRRCERRPTDEEAILAALTGQLTKAVAEAKKAIKGGLDNAQSVLAELRGRRVSEPATRDSVATSTRRPRRTAATRA